MHLSQLLNSAIFAWGLAGFLMLVVTWLAFLRKRQMMKEQTGIFIIILILLLTLLALSVDAQ